MPQLRILAAIEAIDGRKGIDSSMSSGSHWPRCPRRYSCAIHRRRTLRRIPEGVNILPVNCLAHGRRQIMEALYAWRIEQLDERRIEPGSGLGRDFLYMHNRWKALTLFLAYAAKVPLEQMLDKAEFTAPSNCPQPMPGAHMQVSPG